MDSTTNKQRSTIARVNHLGKRQKQGRVASNFKYSWNSDARSENSRSGVTESVQNVDMRQGERSNEIIASTWEPYYHGEDDVLEINTRNENNNVTAVYGPNQTNMNTRVYETNSNVSRRDTNPNTDIRVEDEVEDGTVRVYDPILHNSSNDTSTDEGAYQAENEENNSTASTDSSNDDYRNKNKEVPQPKESTERYAGTDGEADKEDENYLSDSDLSIGSEHSSNEAESQLDLIKNNTM